MGYQRASRVAAVLLLGAFSLLGCAVVDKYSGRAVDYNLEAEKAQEDALFLNIIRASLRRPMQFTSVQSVTGTASASGGTTYTLPTNLPFRPNTLGNNIAPWPPVPTWNFSGSMSGGPAFTVPVLDTQEFYQGILSPIQIQVFDYYIQQGFPPELLFNLLVTKIEIVLHDGSCRKFTFQNNVRDDLQYEQFQAFIDYLVGSGLTTEQITRISQIGPPIPPPTDGASAADVARMLDAYSKASEAGLTIKSESTKEGNGGYQVEKKKKEFRFCFSQRGAPSPSWLGVRPRSLLCGYYTEPKAVDEEGPKCEVIGQGIRLAPLFLRRIDEIQMEHGDRPSDDLLDTRVFARAPVTFNIVMRSTEGILYYLGEVTRRHLFSESSIVRYEPRVIQVKTQLRPGTFPQSECRGDTMQAKTDLVGLNGRPVALTYYCENLFQVAAGAGSDSFLTVVYDGQSYSIPNDRETAGRSTQVFELVRQMLAINTSAKQLPTTTVISVVGP